jgi:DUF2971 family protein
VRLLSPTGFVGILAECRDYIDRGAAEETFMSDQTTNPFATLWSDIPTADNFPERRPLLAHYTSIETLEKILINDEIWFSNPLYMNDMEELRFGLNQGAAAFPLHTGIREACGSAIRHKILLQSFEHQLQEFDAVHAFDTYVLCFSEHQLEDTDGLLSMWRGYGNEGRGVALVIDTQHINVIDLPLFIISKVTYASRGERLNWIANKLTEFATLLAELQLPDERLAAAANAILERLKTFALFTKHRGFEEEHEWRFVHLKQYDRASHLENMLGYSIGKRGLEPKLKFKVVPIDGVTAPDLSLEKLVHQIIVGPSISNALTGRTLERMLIQNGKAALVKRLYASSTPFRPL